MRYVKSVWTTAIQSAALMGCEYTPSPGTTLKDKFNLNVIPVSNQLPKLKYYMIGGNYDSLINSNLIELNASNHLPTDVVVYKPIPFIVRGITEDLTGDERDKYFLRVEVVDKIYYYGKRINEIDASPNLLTGNTENGETNIEKLVITSSMLNPVPVLEGETNLFYNRLDFTGVSLQATIRLTNEELTEIKSASESIYPGEVVEIREIGLVTGVESVNGSDTQELDKAQTAFFIQSNYILDEYIDVEDNNVSLGVELGGLEPHIHRTG